jgi:hypothetical protein
VPVFNISVESCSEHPVINNRHEVSLFTKRDWYFDYTEHVRLLGDACRAPFECWLRPADLKAFEERFECFKRLRGDENKRACGKPDRILHVYGVEAQPNRKVVGGLLQHDRCCGLRVLQGVEFRGSERTMPYFVAVVP